jgi:hypothetical protein
MIKFQDGNFSFFTALYGSHYNEIKIVFRVRSDNQPKQRANEKGITGYDRLIPSTFQEIQAWLTSHPTYQL